MNRQSEIRLAVREAGRDHGPVWPTIVGRLLLFCAAAAVVLLVVEQSRLSSEQRQHVFDASGVDP
jgi:hypothetical protein